MARFQRGTLDVKLDGIATPTDSDQAANKAYVDREIAGAALGENVVGGTGITITENGDSDTISITDGGVGETQLANNAVTTNKIATGAVDTAAIADANVTTAKLADNSVEAAKLAHDLTAANLGLSQDAEGRFRLSPAFVEAASVLALSTQYDSPSSSNQAITRLVTNVDGTGIMSGSVQADSNTNPSITAFNDEWNNVRSVVLATQDASNPTRSIASLAQFFGPGSILEVHRSDSDYAVWAIDSFSSTYTAGNVTYANINQTAWTNTNQTDRYGNPIYSGLLASSGNPGAQFGNNYTIRLHGRDSINDGRLIGDNTVLAEKLQSTNTGTTGQVPSLGSTGEFTWIDAGAAADNSALLDVWHGFDTEYDLVTGSDPSAAGSIRIGRQLGLPPAFSDQTSAGSIFEVRVRPFASDTDLISEMETGSPLRIVQGDTEWVGALTSTPSVSSGLYTFQIGTAGQYVGVGTFDTSRNVTFNFRPQVENPVVPGDFVPNAVRAGDINGGEISPFHMHLESTNTPNDSAAGYIPVSAGPDEGAGWTWHEYHTGTLIPAAEGINDPAVHNVFRVPATGTQSMQKGTVAFTTLNSSSSWGFINQQSGANTIFIDTSSCYVGRYR